MESEEVRLCPGTVSTLVRMFVRVRAYYACSNFPLLDHTVIELFWIDKSFIMIQDDFEKCENIFYTNRGHKKSLIESLSIFFPK